MREVLKCSYFWGFPPFSAVKRINFSVFALEYVSSHLPCVEKPTVQDFPSTGTPTVHVALCEIYCTVCFLLLYMIHTAYQTCTLPCKSPWEPITLKPFTFTDNANVMKMELQCEEVVCEIWALKWSKLGNPSPAWNGWIWGEIMCCSGAATFLIRSVFSLHTLLASKNLCTPLARNHLKGLFSNSKSFWLSLFQMRNKSRTFSLWRRCTVWDFCAELWMKKAQQSYAKQAVIGLLQEHKKTSVSAILLHDPEISNKMSSLPHRRAAAFHVSLRSSQPRFKDLLNAA